MEPENVLWFFGGIEIGILLEMVVVIVAIKISRKE